MYHLQRGPLLDPRFCHADERALLHACFVAAPIDHAGPMALPALHVLNQATGYFEAGAPANLALLPGVHAPSVPPPPSIIAISTRETTLRCMLCGFITGLITIILQRCCKAARMKSGSNIVTGQGYNGACSGAAAVLDCGAHIFVWHGRELPSLRTFPAVRDACSAFAARLAAGRFPLPELRTVAEVRGGQLLCSAQSILS